LLQDCYRPAHACERRWFLLRFQTEHNDPVGLLRWIRLDVGKIQIQCYQYPTFLPDSGGNYLVLRTRQTLVGNGLCIEAGIAQSCVRFDGRAFVYFEFLALSSSGRSMVPSLASSAA
jgi:hypothetical protein